MTTSLFTNSNDELGFRLHYLEVYNWGTFGGNRPFRLNAGGATTLLTGANGSGKTTIIDALLTLLVPKAKRFYNQSSGAESRRERTEESYFWGHYGRALSEGEERSHAEQLRQKGDGAYSVLLAMFYNAARQQHVTLAQVRWWSDELKRAYVFSPYPLNIEEHFGRGRFDLRGVWKKELRAKFPKTDISDTFNSYAQKFSDAFCLKEAAPALFNQTVGIKVLGDLTEFIRRHMLDAPDAEGEFGKLHAQFKDLLAIHRAIRKDEQQLALLQPVVEGHEVLRQATLEVQQAERIQRALSTFFDQLEHDRLSTYLASLRRQSAENSTKHEAAQSRLKTLRQAKSDIDMQLGRLDIAARVSELERRIREENAARADKENNEKGYNALAASLGMATSVDAEGFQQNAALLDAREAKHKTETKDHFRRLTEAESALEQERRKVVDLQRQIDSLLSRQNRIPIELVSVRERLADLLSVKESDLPFAGELIQVSRAESLWEEAIEKLLHSFALELLVAEKHHERVAQFVKTNNLRTRLVYQRIDLKAAPTMRRRPKDDAALINKLEMKDDSLFSAWMEKQLLERFDYTCTDDLADFHRCDKALTSSCLMRNKARHEKNDAPQRGQRRDFVLGWDNGETIVLLGQEKEDAAKEAAQLSELIARLKKAEAELDGKSQSFYNIRTIRSFAELNWKEHVLEAEELQRQRAELLQSSDAFRQLENEKERLERLIEEQDKEAGLLAQESGRLSSETAATERRLAGLSLTNMPEEEAALIGEFLQAASEQPAPDAHHESIPAHRKRATRIIAEKVTNGNRRLSNQKADLLVQMQQFIQPAKAVTDEFPDWGSDTLHLSASIESLDEMATLHETIRSERLTDHQQQFRDYMDESMLNALTGFATWIENEREVIRGVIEKLNAPLRNIVFNKSPDTYLQLEHRDTRDMPVRNFQARLGDCVPDATRLHQDEHYREEAFLRIQSLINELQEKETWRKEVTDARNWLYFGAHEHYREDGRQRNYYDNTASLSGGQKAQLTYAILGAAIAHQFGIFQNPVRSLRFITVDEAFSKLDPDKSRFLMEYCAQLHLQLLIVTPLDKINIAEPFISAVHYTEIRDGRNSYLYNLTMEEYEEKRSALDESLANEEAAS